MKQKSAPRQVRSGSAAERGIILGFYQDEEAANAAFKELRNQRHRRSAAIHHSSDGQITVDGDSHLPGFGVSSALITRYNRWVTRN